MAILCLHFSPNTALQEYTLDMILLIIFEDFTILDLKMKFLFYYLLLGVEHSNKFYKQIAAVAE